VKASLSNTGGFVGPWIVGWLAKSYGSVTVPFATFDPKTAMASLDITCQRLNVRA
jgi:hypothetical protein